MADDERTGSGGGSACDNKIVVPATMTSAAAVSSSLSSKRNKKNDPVPSGTTQQRQWNDDDDADVIDEGTLMVLLGGNKRALGLFKYAYLNGVDDRHVLESLAILSSTPDTASRRQQQTKRETSTSTSPASASSRHSEAIKSVCSFLVKKRDNLQCQYICLYILIHLRTLAARGGGSRRGTRWQLSDQSLQEALRFVTDRDFQWEQRKLQRHTEQMLLWELRACTLHLLHVQVRSHQQRQRQLHLLSRSGDVVAGSIITGSRWIESGLDYSTHIVTDGIETAGEMVKDVIEPNQGPPVVLFQDEEAEKLSLSYTGAARRASADMYEKTNMGLTKVQDQAVRGVEKVTDQLENEDTMEKWVPHPETRTALQIAGHVGGSLLGGALIVGDAVRENTRSVFSKTAAVTADVVQYRYGENAAQLVRNTSETAGNVALTLANVSVASSKGLAKVVAKSTGLVHIQRTEDS